MEKTTRSGKAKRTERMNIRATMFERNIVAKLMVRRNMSSEADAIFTAVMESLERDQLAALLGKMREKLHETEQRNRQIKEETGEFRDYLDGVEVTLKEVIKELTAIRNPLVEVTP